MSSPKVLIILGAGSNTGAKVAEKFIEKGYKALLVSRSGTTVKGGFSIELDLSDPESVGIAFKTCIKEFGSAPNIVIFNVGAYHTVWPALSLDKRDLIDDLTANVISGYLAAQEAVNGWETLPDGIPKSFIYTGNALNQANISAIPSLGMSKMAAHYFIEAAINDYSGKGYTFYYGDERTPEGKSTHFNIDGDAHADFYFPLAHGLEQGPMIQTFVKGQGYIYFPKAEVTKYEDGVEV